MLESLIDQLNDLLPEGYTIDYTTSGGVHIIHLLDSDGSPTKEFVDKDLVSVTACIVEYLDGGEADPETLWAPQKPLDLHLVVNSSQPDPEDLDPTELRSVYDGIRKL